MLNAVHLSHTFDGAFTLSAGGHNATDTFAGGSQITVIQDRVSVSLAVDRHLVTVIRLPKDAVRPDLLRCHVTKRLDLDVHAELPRMRDAFGHHSTGAPFGGCDLEKELAPVLDVHVGNVQVEWLCGAIEARSIGVKVEFEDRTGTRLNGPKGMPNPTALHPHLRIRSEELVMLKFDGKGEQLR